MAGKLLSDRADIVLHYGSGSQAVHSKTFSLAKANAVAGDLLRKFWAQKKIDELMMQPEENEKEIVETGRLHGIVTPGTSLIVLDSLEQYVENEIRPPATLSEMRRDYDERMADQVKEKQEKTESKIERVLALWKERVQWWEQQFEYPRILSSTPITEGSDGNRNDGDGSPRRPFMPASPAMVQAMPSVAAEEAPQIAASPPSPATEESAMAPQSGEGPDLAAPEIELKAWNPETPYLDVITKAPSESKYDVYLEQKREFGNSPAFFLDCADYFRTRGCHAKPSHSVNIAKWNWRMQLCCVLAHRLPMGYGS